MSVILVCPELAGCTYMEARVVDVNYTLIKKSFIKL